MQSPCYGCKERTVTYDEATGRVTTCHATCKRYAKYDAFKAEQRRRRIISRANSRPKTKPVKGKKNEWRQLR